MSEQKLVTIADLRKSLPTRKTTITQEIVDIINASIEEPEFQGSTFIQSVVTYEQVMQKHNASIKEYLSAIKFCAYLISTDENQSAAYKKTFYNREFVQARLDAEVNSVGYREITSAASRYRRSPLVIDILTVSQVPLDMMFAGARYKALGVLAQVMETAKYDRDKINAAKELLAATKGSDNMKVELEIGPSTAAVSMQNKLLEQLSKISETQYARLTSGEDIASVQNVGIGLDVIEADVE